MPARRPYARRTPEIEARICDVLASGGSWSAAERLPGLPKRQTIAAWARCSPEFARRMEDARAWGQSRLADSRHAPFFYRDLPAHEFLAKVRAGASIRRLLRETPSFNRPILDSWKRQSPWFAAELVAASAEGARRRGAPRRAPCPYDEATSDRIILRLTRGETLRGIARDPALPTFAAIQRWRRDEDHFDGAVRTAMRVGKQARGRRMTDELCSPQLTRRITRAIMGGASLRSLDGRPGIPTRQTLGLWVRTRPDFRDAVQRAYRVRAHVLKDKVMWLAEQATDATAPAAQRKIDKLKRKLALPHPGEKTFGRWEPPRVSLVSAEDRPPLPREARGRG